MSFISTLDILSSRYFVSSLKTFPKLKQSSLTISVHPPGSKMFHFCSSLFMSVCYIFPFYLLVYLSFFFVCLSIIHFCLFVYLSFSVCLVIFDWLLFLSSTVFSDWWMSGQQVKWHFKSDIQSSLVNWQFVHSSLIAKITQNDPAAIRKDKLTVLCQICFKD